MYIFIIGFLVLILGILVTLLKSVLALWPMEVTGLEGLVLALGRTLVVMFIVVLAVVVAAAVAIVATDGLALVSMMRMTVFMAAILAPVIMICIVAKLLLVALCKRVTEFVLGSILDLLLALLHERAVGHLQVKNILEILGNGLKFLIKTGVARSRGTLYDPLGETACRTTQF